MRPACASACAVVAGGRWLVAGGRWLVARGSWLVARESALHMHCAPCCGSLMARGTGMLPYKVEVVEDDAAVTAYAGLPLIVETMRTLGVSEQLDKELGIRQRNTPS